MIESCMHCGFAIEFNGRAWADLIYRETCDGLPHQPIKYEETYQAREENEYQAG